MDQSTPPIEETPSIRKRSFIINAKTSLLLVLFGLLLGVLLSRFLPISTSRTLQTIPPVPPEPTIASSDWKIYTNDKYSFSLDIPATAIIASREADPLPVAVEIDSTDFSVELPKTSSRNSWAVIISVPQDNPNNLSLKDWSLHKLSNYFDPQFVTITQTTIGGQEALISKVSPDFYQTYYVVKTPDSKIIYISTTRIGDTTSDPLISRILSSFKFTSTIVPVPQNSKIFLNTLNRPGGEQKPRKMLIYYDMKDDDKAFFIIDPEDQNIQTGLIIQRDDITLNINPAFEGFPMAHTDSFAVSLDGGTPIGTSQIYRTISETNQGSFEYVNNYTIGSSCGEPKPNTVACSQNNIETNKGVNLQISCKATLSNVSVCDEIVKSFSFLWIGK